jgi:hypothetical protein
VRQVLLAITSVLIVLAFRSVVFAVLDKAQGVRWRNQVGSHKGATDRTVSVSLTDLAAARLLANRLHYTLHLFGMALITIIFWARPLSQLAFASACGILSLLAWERYRWPRLLYAGITGTESLAYGRGFVRYHYPNSLWRRFFLGFLTCGPLWLIGTCMLAIPGLIIESPEHLAPPPFRYLYPPTYNPWLIAAMAVVTGSGLIAIADRFERTTRRKDLERGTASTSSSGRETVLLLRQFGMETTYVRAHVGPRRPGFMRMIPERRIHLEDCLTWLLWGTARVVAIRNPQSRQETLGAAHHQVQSGEKWQRVVTDLACEAVLIIAINGQRPGIQWELGTVLKSPRLKRKTMVINPPGGDPIAFLGTISQHVSTNITMDKTEHPILGVYFPHGIPRILYSSAQEDVDYESAAEYVLRHVRPNSASSLLS